MILIDLSNTIKKLREKISFHKHFKETVWKFAMSFKLTHGALNKNAQHMLHAFIVI